MSANDPHETQPPDWVDLCDADGLSAEQGRFVTFNGRNLAVFLAGPGKVRVIDDSCPHAGGSLSAGHVDDAGCVVCPWHAWPFNLASGSCPDNPAIRVRTYRARIENGRVQIMP